MFESSGGSNEITGCILNSRVGQACQLSILSLLEYCFVDTEVRLITNDYCLLNNCMLTSSELSLTNLHEITFNVPANICMHTIPIKSGVSSAKYLTIFFDRNDDLKKNYELFSSMIFLGKLLPDEVTESESQLKHAVTDANSIWNLRIFKACNTMSESFVWALKFVNGYLSSRLDTEVFTESVSNMYSLFDVLKVNDYERMISFRIDNGLM